MTLISHAIKVAFKGVMVGEYAADLFVDDKVIMALKVTPKSMIHKMSHSC